ncbi:ABC transporter ATP-binding protein [Thermofilum pendens]|uniref:ABC transporter related n=1 Tax=Thermofilum pendens (strain DSM 2475 / Hrk 5) TaxID=368408 RepID=A1S0G3_THEPD|nr:ABC transporter ATP-binding protein [Thermofilum pendens]ABL78943.1 ABC transporter related [Thermofilum pendens Hrk 5]
MVGVRLEHVTKRYGKVVAVDDVSLEVKEGEFFVLLGPSGCGKTTTLRIIAGLEEPDEGRVFFGEEDVTRLPPGKRKISMVFQSYAVWPHMKVYDNIALPLKVQGYPPEEIERRVREAARLVQIEDLLDRYPQQLSGGQRQRVAVARALAVTPRVLLMDEPLSNLDALLRVQARAELKRLQRDTRLTTIYVTHDQVEAMVLADRVAVMNRGRVLQVGPPEEIYSKPSSRFVAHFIGSPPINLFEGTVTPRGVDVGFVVLPVGAGSLEEYSGKRVIVGIRPEDVHLTASPGFIEVEGSVWVTENLGGEYVVLVSVGDVILRARSREKPESERVKVYLDPSKLHFFDKETEARIFS